MRKMILLLTVAALLVAPMAMGDGAAVFKAKCASCHGPDGSGLTGMGKAMKLRDLGSADVQKQSDGELTTITTDGKGKMPAYKGKISDDEIKQVIAFMRTLKK